MKGRMLSAASKRWMCSGSAMARGRGWGAGTGLASMAAAILVSFYKQLSRNFAFMRHAQR